MAISAFSLLLGLEFCWNAFWSASLCHAVNFTRGILIERSDKTIDSKNCPTLYALYASNNVHVYLRKSPSLAVLVLFSPSAWWPSTVVFSSAADAERVLSKGGGGAGVSLSSSSPLPSFFLFFLPLLDPLMAEADAKNSAFSSGDQLR